MRPDNAKLSGVKLVGPEYITGPDGKPYGLATIDDHPAVRLVEVVFSDAGNMTVSKRKTYLHKRPLRAKVPPRITAADLDVARNQLCSLCGYEADRVSPSLGVEE